MCVCVRACVRACVLIDEHDDAHGRSQRLEVRVDLMVVGCRCAVTRPRIAGGGGGHEALRRLPVFHRTPLIILVPQLLLV